MSEKCECKNTDCPSCMFQEPDSEALPPVAGSSSSMREGKVFFAYRGPLFGKRGRKYIPLKMTSDNVDEMERKLLVTQNELLAASATIYRMARTNDDYIAAAHFKRCAEYPENVSVEQPPGSGTPTTQTEK